MQVKWKVKNKWWGKKTESTKALMKLFAKTYCSNMRDEKENFVYGLRARESLVIPAIEASWGH